MGEPKGDMTFSFGNNSNQATTVYQINVQDANQVADILQVISEKIKTDKQQEEEF